MFSESTYENENFCQNLSKSHFSFTKYEGGANLHHPPQDGGFGDPPKIGLRQRKPFFPELSAAFLGFGASESFDSCPITHKSSTDEYYKVYLLYIYLDNDLNKPQK